MIVGPVTGAELAVFRQKMAAAVEDLPKAIDPVSVGFSEVLEEIVVTSYTRLAETLESAVLAFFAEAAVRLDLRDRIDSPEFRDLKDAVCAYRREVMADAMSQLKNTAMIGMSAGYHVLADREAQGHPPVKVPSEDSRF